TLSLHDALPIWAVHAAWSSAISQDVHYPGVRGGRPGTADRVVGAYARRMMRAATGSYPAARAVWDVTSMRTPAVRMFRPDTVLAVLAGSPLPPSTEPPLTRSERELLRRLDRTGR